MLFFFACFLKKSTLLLFKDMVTFTFDSFRSNSLGGGKKSEIVLAGAYARARVPPKTG